MSYPSVHFFFVYEFPEARHPITIISVIAYDEEEAKETAIKNNLVQFVDKNKCHYAIYKGVLSTNITGVSREIAIL
jgi:hypothetical protein